MTKRFGLAVLILIIGIQASSAAHRFFPFLPFPMFPIIQSTVQAQQGPQGERGEQGPAASLSADDIEMLVRSLVSEDIYRRALAEEMEDRLPDPDSVEESEGGSGDAKTGDSNRVNGLLAMIASGLGAWIGIRR